MDFTLTEEQQMLQDSVERFLEKNYPFELRRDMVNQRGTTVFFSTHVMEQAEQICDFIFLIDHGKKVLDGPLSEVRKGGSDSSTWPDSSRIWPRSSRKLGSSGSMAISASTSSSALSTCASL